MSARNRKLNSQVSYQSNNSYIDYRDPNLRYTPSEQSQSIFRRKMLQDGGMHSTKNESRTSLVLYDVPQGITDQEADIYTSIDKQSESQD